MVTQALPDLGRVIIEPAPTFARLKDKPNGWLPLLVSILLTLALMYWWTATEDFAWLREHMMAAHPEMKPEARAAMASFMTPNKMLLTSGGGAAIGTVLLIALTAVYFLIAARLIGSDIGYGKWFAFVAWSSVPRLLVVPLMALQIATSHGQLAPEDMNMVSFNYLLFHLPLTHPWASFANSLDLATFWTIALATIGLKAWTGKATGTCVTIAALPYVVVYGLWAAKIAFIG
ncbi:MAG: YIP1 family protein [Telluria sp.]